MAKQVKEKKEKVIVAKAETFMPKVEKKDLYYELMELGVPKKFANMNHPLICKTKGTIRVESIRRNKFKQPNVSYCRTYDKSTRITYGIPIGVDEKGKIILKRFYLPEYRVFDLTNQDEAEEWAILKHHEIMQPGGQFRIYDEEKVAEDAVNEITLIEQAIGIARDMKLKDWIPAARFFGKQPDGMSAIKLQSEIMNVAKNTPSELINYWQQENREVVDIFSAAEAIGIIHHDYLKGWLYKKTLPIGSTKEAAIRFISKDTSFCKALLEETKRDDATMSSIIGGKGAPKKKSTFDVDDDENKELFDLKYKAKLLNIKGYDNLDIEQLKERVASAEALVLQDEE